MIDEKKLPFYLLLDLEKYLAAKNQHLCYENSLRNEFYDTLRAAWVSEEISDEEYMYLKDTYLRQ